MSRPRGCHSDFRHGALGCVLALALSTPALAAFQGLTEVSPYEGQPGGISGVNVGSLALTFGASGITGTVVTTAASGGVGVAQMPKGWHEMVGNTAAIWDYLTEAPGPLPGYTRPGPQIFLNTPRSSSQTMRVSFSPPVIAPYLHVTGLEASKLTVGPPLSVAVVSKNEVMQVSGNTLNTVYARPNGGDGCRPDGAAGTPDDWRHPRCGTFMLGDGPVGVVDLINESHGSEGGDGWNSSWSFPLLVADKAFGQPSIAIGGTTTLTVTLVNPTPGVLSGMSWQDQLPAGLSLADGTGQAVGCGSPSFGAPANLDVSGIAIAPGGVCTLTFTVTGSTAGSHVFDNGQFTANAGNLLPGPDVTLNVTAAPPPVHAVPTLSQWTLLLLGGLLSLWGAAGLVRRTRT